MLGLWEAGTMPINVSLHVAFQVALSDLMSAAATAKGGSSTERLSGPPN